jgi:hypothetical protein
MWASARQKKTETNLGGVYFAEKLQFVDVCTKQTKKKKKKPVPSELAAATRGFER